MIDEKELRLNNLVNVMYHGSYEPMEVVEITDYGLLHVRLGIHRLANPVHVKTDVSPIPLTPEWLERFGWVWNSETETFEKFPNGDARMHLKERTLGGYGMFNYVLKATIVDSIHYVHQLQNLYFALTGQELVLSPTKEPKHQHPKS